MIIQRNQCRIRQNTSRDVRSITSIFSGKLALPSEYRHDRSNTGWKLMPWQRCCLDLRQLACISSLLRKAQIPLVSSRHVTSWHDTTSTTCRARREERVERVELCLFQHGGRRRTSSARVYTSLVVDALDLHQSQKQFMEKVRRTCPPQSTLWRHHWTRVVRVAPVVTSVSRRAVRHVRLCSYHLIWRYTNMLIIIIIITSATRLVTSRYDFSLYQNEWAGYSVSWRAVMSQVEFGRVKLSTATARHFICRSCIPHPREKKHRKLLAGGLHPGTPPAADKRVVQEPVDHCAMDVAFCSRVTWSTSPCLLTVMCGISPVDAHRLRLR